MIGKLDVRLSLAPEILKLVVMKVLLILMMI